VSAAARRFGGSILEDLAARTGPTATAAQAIPLDAIEEDPNQPRRHFDPAALDMLAASIRLAGVLQPVGVRQIAPGRYRLAWGARRWRAARLAGLTEIPAVLVAAGQVSTAAQVIENQQRLANSNSELAAAVARMTADGMTTADIATVLALSDPQSVRYYRVVEDLAAPLAAWVDRAPVRALYELHQARRKDAGGVIVAELERLDREGEELTMTVARRIVAAATGKHAGSFDKPAAAPPSPAPSKKPARASAESKPEPASDASAEPHAVALEPWFIEARDLAARAAELLHRNGMVGTVPLPFGCLIVDAK
jgi:ParB family transcriptional regulator, chromosome partitioning protein